MARTEAGAALTASHQRLQGALAARTLRRLLALWPSVDTQRPETFDLFSRAATLLVLAGNRESAGLASAYLAGFRIAEGEPPAPTAQLAAPPAEALVADRLRASAVVGILNARRAGLPAQSEASQGWVSLAGQATTLVLGGGRRTVLEAVSTGGRIRGWQRVTVGGCAFCAMLASRGPVYSGATASFDAHDHCRCSAEPVYAGSRLPAQSAAYLSLWDRATAGLSGPDAIAAFRHALEAPAEAAA